MQTVEVAGDSFAVPRSVEAQGDQARWLADELNSRGLVPFDPFDRTAEEVIEAIGELDSDELARLYAVETRVTARTEIRAALTADDD